jgi:hypothetical protein
VLGKIRLKHSIPFSSNGFFFELICNEYGVVKEIKAEVRNVPSTEWPKVTPSKTPGINADIEIKSPKFDVLRPLIRAIEGRLALFGLKGIHVERCRREWIPESQYEEEQLNLSSFQISKKERDDSELDQMPVDLVVRCFYHPATFNPIEVGLAFYRRGAIDAHEERPIDAIYDFYLMLETLFGEGKSKNQQVKEAFRNSPVLIRCVSAALNDEILMLGLQSNADLLSAFQSRYGHENPQIALDEWVELRGFLHHHAARRPNNWHPDEQKRFEVDARVMQYACMNVAFELTEDLVHSDAARQWWYSQVDQHGNEIQRFK